MEDATTDRTIYLEDITFDKSVITLLGNGHSITSNTTANRSIGINRNATLNLGLEDGSDKLTIKGNENDRHTQALIDIYGGTLNMYSGVSLKDYNAGQTARYGAGVNVASGGTFNMFGGSISNCILSRYLEYGGGVAVEESTFNMMGGSIYNNAITNPNGSYGGGVAVLNGTFNMSGGEIYGNTASRGGGVFAYGTSVFNMTGGKIHDNIAVRGGGVYLITGSCSFEMADGEIYDNSASQLGGGVYISSTNTFTMKNGKIYHNDAEQAGGGVFTFGIFNMIAGEIYGNTALEGGGAFFSTQNKLSTISGIIHSNSADIDGDDIVASNSDCIALKFENKCWYDGARNTGEVDDEGESIYDDRRWNASEEKEEQYLYKYTQPLNGEYVALKVEHVVNTQTDYTVVHEYYTNGIKVGEIELTDCIGNAGNIISADNINKLASYANNKYEYTSSEPSNIVLNKDGDNKITLKYDRTVENDVAVQVGYIIIHEYYTNGIKDGEFKVTDCIGNLGNTISADDINKLASFANNKYEYISSEPSSIVLNKDEDNIIILRYDRTIKTDPDKVSDNEPGDKAVPDNESKSGTTKPPKTGDNFKPMLAIITMICSLAVIIFFTKKSKKNR